MELLADPSAARELGRQTYQEVMRDHTTEARACYFLTECVKRI